MIPYLDEVPAIPPIDTGSANSLGVRFKVTL
jgi:hypothetical protein